MRSWLSRMKVHLRLAVWKVVLRFRGWKVAQEYADINATYWIEPGRIELSLDHSALDRLDLNAPKSLDPLAVRGVVQGGDWDCGATLFEEMDVWVAFRHRFVEGGSWRETGFFRRLDRTIRGGVAVFGCGSSEDLEARLDSIDALYREIAENGFRTQEEIRVNAPTSFGAEDEITVHIGRDGDYLFADGRHRLSIAKLLGLKEIPVKVARRHSDWVDFRRQVLLYAEKHGGELYSKVRHPDLVDIPCAHSDSRMPMLSEGLRRAYGHGLPYDGTLVDIGAHWGLVTQTCEKMGFECTAVEVDPVNVHFMEKLRKAEGCSFRIDVRSVLDLTGPLVYDVVVAWNIFHHFIKAKTDYQRFLDFLSRLETKVMLFEPHDPDEPQMRDAYWNPQPLEFAEFLGDAAGLSKADLIGSGDDGRQLYVLHSEGKRECSGMRPESAENGLVC